MKKQAINKLPQQILA